MKKLFALIISALSTTGIFAQMNDGNVLKLAHEFGMHAGATTAVGISYRYWPTDFGVQLTALPIKTSNETWISLGITGLYSFHESRTVHFFGYFGNNLIIDNHSSYTNPVYPYNTEYVNHSRYNIGIGPGFAFGTRVRFNIMAGYGFYDVFGEFLIYPTGEIGLYFRY